MTAEQPKDLDQLVEELRLRVAERRKAGMYPEHLEEELEDHFRRVVADRLRSERGYGADLPTPDLQMVFSADRIDFDSGLPGGSAIHRSIGKLVRRQTEGILEQVQGFADAVRDAVAQLTEAWRESVGEVWRIDEAQHGQFVGDIDAIFERLASYERGPTGSEAAVADLRRRVEMLESDRRAHTFAAPFTADAFESTFRGSKEELKGRYRDLAERLVGQDPVLDIGCGRGEFIEMLGELGVEARGIELDEALAAAAREAGLDVSAGDGITALASVPDDSLGGIVLLQVVEHLTPQNVVDVVEIARHKLRPGGLMVVETVNPQSLYVYAHSFYLDPTHVSPIHPAYLKFLFGEAGYRDVTIDWRSPPPVEDTLKVDPEGGPVAAANVERLNELLFAPQDYALLARR